MAALPLILLRACRLLSWVVRLRRLGRTDAAAWIRSEVHRGGLLVVLHVDVRPEHVESVAAAVVRACWAHVDMLVFGSDARIHRADLALEGVLDEVFSIAWFVPLHARVPIDGRARRDQAHFPALCGLNLRVERR